MSAGMRHMSNDIIYDGKLRDDRGIGLKETLEAQALKKYIGETHTSYLICPAIL